MQTENHWAATAAAMEATVEGNRQITLAVADALKQAWHNAMHWLAVTAASTAAARHLPPV